MRMLLIKSLSLSILLVVISCSFIDAAEPPGDSKCCCNVEEHSLSSNRWTTALVYLGNSHYYFQTFFKTNWHQAAKYCRFHGLDLVVISSIEEHFNIAKHLNESGYDTTSTFWTSGTDLGSQGAFSWLSNGRPVFRDSDYWMTGQPDNHKFPDETEHCLGYLFVENKWKWNDWRCSVEMFFICELQ